MLKKFLRVLADSDSPTSLANKFRRRRFELLAAEFARFDARGSGAPMRILDVGGTPDYWDSMREQANLENRSIVLLNLPEDTRPTSNYETAVGDATDLREYADNSFDLVFSNSVIEHVGLLDAQVQMAKEVARVGKRYVVQTPSRYFPIEPHFLFPFFGLFPLSVRATLIQHVNLGWRVKKSDRTVAVQEALSVNLMRRSHFHAAFPGSSMHVERLLLWTKSYTVVGGDPARVTALEHVAGESGSV